MKRISMAGSDVAVTDDRLADLVLEYAMQLGQVGTTDSVTIPMARNGRLEEASLLLGPASQIALVPNDDPELEGVALPGVDAVADDIGRRIDHVSGRRPRTVLDDVAAPLGADGDAD